MAHVDPSATRPSWWERLKTFEPALLRAIVTSLVIVLGLVGINATEVGDKIVTGWEAIFVLFPLIQAWWTRGAVTPNAKVLVSTNSIPEARNGDEVVYRVNGL